MIPHLLAEITHGISRKCCRPRWFHVVVGLTYRAGCAFESSNICACHIHRVQLVPREKRRVMRCGMHTCVTHTYTHLHVPHTSCNSRKRNIARESTLRGRLVPHPNASDIRFSKVGQGSFRRCISTRDFLPAFALEKTTTARPNSQRLPVGEAAGRCWKVEECKGQRGREGNRGGGMIYIPRARRSYLGC